MLKSFGYPSLAFLFSLNERPFRAMLYLQRRTSMFPPRRKLSLAHLVMRLALRRASHVLGLQLVRDANIQVSTVLLIRLTAEATLDALAGLDGQNVRQVEDGLLPVRVLCVRPCGELDWLVAGAELDVEPRYQGVHVVGAAHRQAEGGVEGQVGYGAFVQVEGQDCGWVCHDGFHVHRVDQWLGQGGVL